MSEIPNITMETIRNTISENLGGPAHALASPENSFSLDEVPDLSGKVNSPELEKFGHVLTRVTGCCSHWW